MKEQSFGIIPFYKDDECLKVFLIHQYGSSGDTLWTFPKGRPNPGESPLETAERECMEETNLVPSVLNTKQTVGTTYTFTRKGTSVEKTSTYYVGFVSNMAFVTQPEEVKEAGWFSIPDARERITFPEYKVLLDEAVALLDNLS